MKTLIHFGPAFGLPDVSPFCVKVEAYLRMQGLEYRTKRGNPMKSKRGQLPVLIDDGQVICDSSSIIAYLRANCEDRVDHWLTPEQNAEGYMLEKAVEEYLYFLMLYQRWLLPGNYQVTARQFAKGLPIPLKWILPRYIRYSARQRAIKQGVGRMAPHEVEEAVREGCRMLSLRLGEKKFFMGDKPCWVDAAMWGSITHALNPAFPEGAGEFIRSLTNLVDYDRRFKSLYFEELLLP